MIDDSEDKTEDKIGSESKKSAIFWSSLFFLAVLGLLVILLTQSPGSGGPYIVLGFLLCIFLVTLSGLIVLQNAVAIRMRGGSSSARSVYIALAVATGFIYLVGLQTLRQLQVIDVALVVIFEALVNFYLVRRF